MDSIQHREIWEQLGWHAAGSLGAAEAAAIEAHVAECADCRAELAFQRRVRDGLLQAEAAPHDAEPALGRLLARIDAGAAVPAPRRATGSARVQRWLAAAVVVQAVALAATSAALWQRGGSVPVAASDASSDAADSAPYRTLTGERESPPARVRLVPAPALDFAHLQALLSRHALRVVEVGSDGHTLGLAPTAAGDAVLADVTSLVQALRAEPGVLLAEPVAEPAAPR